MAARCPICNHPALPRARNRAFPFCSERCKLVDLGKWLSEEYRVPVEEQASDESGGNGQHPNEEKR
jgi:endogenous inhibitor of DNA gyrase (YacG/DUF329 family)